MNQPKYDQISEFYLSFIQRGLEDESSIFHLAINAIFELAGELSGKKVCDLACGEGYLSRMHAGRGAKVVGVDLSEKLLWHAQQRSQNQAITYLREDAQVLEKLEDRSFDAVICNLALMDIPDIRSAFQAVHRVLKKDGCFVFSILHPCFETPFQVPESPIEIDEQGNFVAIRVWRYTAEGYWNSGGDGMRGRVGAYHRMLSTYFNTLMDSGFQAVRLLEPGPSPQIGGSKTQKESMVPTLLVVKAAPG